ncbi:MAG: hypothetical protein P6D49_04985 [Acidimicrobiales bacterium]|nr:hypothetical protein [Acidimicrobiales bacterium]
MRSLSVAGIALVLVTFVLFLGTCSRTEDDTPAPTTTTSTSTTSTSSTTTTTTTLDPASLGTLPPVEGIGSPKLGTTSSVTTVGLDTVYFGMTAADAQIAAGSRFTPITPVDDCFLVTPDDALEGITFWIVSGTVERVDIDTDEITTRSGAGIGDTENRITNMFPDRIQASPLPDGSGNLLAFVPRDESDREFRVMFQTDGEKVVRMWAGRLPWAAELGGCPVG